MFCRIPVPSELLKSSLLRKDNMIMREHNELHAPVEVIVDTPKDEPEDSVPNEEKRTLRETSSAEKSPNAVHDYGEELAKCAKADQMECLTHLWMLLLLMTESPPIPHSLLLLKKTSLATLLKSPKHRKL